jgi:uncharacterized protein (TIGR03663 family)
MEDNIENEQKKIDYMWLLNCGLVTAVAAFIRFFALSLKPFHHDEGVNGFFLNTLFRDGVYKYDPANYHGPTLYYISLVFSKVFGLDTFSVRASVAIFGVLTVVLIFFLKNYIGKIGSLAAGLFIALSPGMVFISRYFIHEIFFVFLSLAIVISVLFFIEKPKAGPFAIGWMVLLLLICFLPSALILAGYVGGDNTTAVWAFRLGFFIVEAVLVFLVTRMLLAWNNGRPIYLLLASASVALMFATKETAFITIGTFLIACGSLWIWQKIYKTRLAEGDADELSDDRINWANFRNALGEGSNFLLIIAAVVAVFLYVSVLFFTSFFTYPEGIQKALDAYTIWTKTGSKDHTQNGTWGYLKWGMEIEAPILLLSALGILIAFFKSRHRVAMFIGLWAFGLFAAYSIIPYKTPWLALSFLLPMGIIAGYGINEMVRMKNTGLTAAAGLLAVTASAVLAYQAYDLNFVRYDKDDRPYVYAHTKREFLDMMAKIEGYAAKSGKGTDTQVDIVSPDYWPMVWNVRNYPKAVFHGRMIDSSNAEMIVAKKGDQDRDVIAKYSANYKYEGIYPLRPGVDLVLLVRNDLADGNAKELYRLRNPN